MEGPTAESLRDAVVSAVSNPTATGYANALRAIGAALAELGGGMSTRELHEELDALRDMSGLHLNRTDRLKAALGHAVGALEKVVRRTDGGTLQEWADAAAASVQKIDSFAPLELQRAAIQDALRATADAVLVARLLDRRGQDVGR